jgi:hypothetical protein
LLDAVHLERRGIPTVTFVTAPFESAARAHAAIHGLPDIPLIIVASDYLDSGDTGAVAAVSAVFDQVVAELLGSAP